MIVGANTPSAIYVGANQVDKGYLGASQFYAKAWTPAEISITAWFDATDVSTVTESAGAVSQWDDKSGNSRHATQAIGSDQFTTGVNSINGLNALACDGDHMDLPAISASSNIHLFFVVRNRATGDGRQGGLVVMTSDTSIPHFGHGPGGVGQWYESFYSTSRPLLYTGAGVVSPKEVLGYVVQDGTNLRGLVHGYGTENSVPATFTGTPTRNYIGSEFGTMTYIDYGELILIQSPTTDEKEKLEGYLAWKWGLEASLPALHPYKNSHPTI